MRNLRTIRMTAVRSAQSHFCEAFPLPGVHLTMDGRRVWLCAGQANLLKRARSEMAHIGIPHPLDPDWKWKRFTKRSIRASDGRLKPWILSSFATLNRLLDRFGFSVQHTGGNEVLIRIGSKCVRLQRLY